MKQSVYKIVKAKDKKIIVPGGTRILILDYIDKASFAKSLSISIGTGAQVQYVLILDTKTSFHAKISREINLAAQAHLASYQIYFGQGNYQLAINNYLAKKAILNSQVLFWPQQKQSMQVHDNYIFKEPGAQGQLKLSGLIDDSAEAQYYSEVIVKPKAQLTRAQIDMNLYLLSSKAQGQLVPSLKIAADDVKTGHSASTLNLAPEDLFYLRSRGLNSAQIKNLIINSLTSRFVAGIKDSKVKDLILELVNKRNK